MSGFSFTAENKARIGVMISGRGSNMLSLAEAARSADAPFEIALVLSNEADAKGLAAARDLGLETAIVPHRDYPKDKPRFEAAMTEALTRAGCDLICLAGFMRILTAEFLLGDWRDRILNIHPSLLPSFRGLHTHRRALEAGVRLHGATVHLARPEVDEGPILAQIAVQVRWNDDEDALAARVLAEEHKLYPAALSAYATGALRLSEDRERIIGDVAQAG